MRAYRNGPAIKTLGSEVHIFKLPVEIILMIGSYLSHESLALLCLRNTYLRDVFSHEISASSIASSALLWAVKVGQSATFSFALRCGANVNSTGQGVRTALSFAAERGDVLMVEILLAKEVLVTKDISVSFQWAASNGHVDVIDSLLRMKHGSIECALLCATSNYHPEAVARLIRDADLDLYGEDLMCTAAGYRGINLDLDLGNDTAALVKLYLAAGVPANAYNSSGMSALQVASKNNLKAMEALMAAGADVNDQKYDSETPLMRAVRFEFMDGVDVLIRARDIKLDLQDNVGNTALSIAESYGTCKTIVAVLLAAGAQGR
ncbi:hypothetical protein PMIN02_009825 [Paraphaeosphaeria minitans]